MTDRERGATRGVEHIGKAAVFRAVARSGSFSAGAEALGMARSTVSEHVRALEEALGARLLERTTRRVRLTDEGQLLLERLNVALDAWEDAWDALEARRAEPIGRLRVTAPAGLAASLVAPACAAAMREHPRLDIDLIVDDRVRDLTAESIDVAVRMAPLDGSTYHSEEIARTRTIVVAAPGFVDPDHREIAHLELYSWVGHEAITSSRYHIYDPHGVRHEFQPRVRGSGSNSEGQIALVEGACGLALMPAILVRAAIERGDLVRAFSELAGRTLPIFAVTQSPRATTSRVARFLECLAALADDEPGVGQLPP